MTTPSHQALHEAGAAVRYAVQGQPVTYVRRTGGRDGDSTVIDEAIVQARAEQGFQDEEGRFWSRAIDVEFSADALDGAVRRYDEIEYDGQRWTVLAVLSHVGAHRLVAVRPERIDVSGTPVRRDRRLTSPRDLP